jgi:Xaa-Pro aminopeptidase
MPHRRSSLPIALLATLLVAAAQPDRAPAVVATAGPTGPDSLAIPAKVLEWRRKALFELIEPGIAVIRGADPIPSHRYPQATDFRQDNDFFYLTGIEEPGSWLVLFKAETGSGKVILYVPERDSGREMWTGERLGIGPELERRTGIETVRPATAFGDEVLSRLGQSYAFREFPTLYLPLSGSPDRSRRIVDAAVEGRRSISDLGPALAALRLVKDSVELARLRRAVDITAEAQRKAMAAARPGMYEFELEAIIEFVFRSRGAERVGFPSIVGSGPNSVILHYDENRRRMEKSDLVVIDIGAELGYYTADITRTFPVSGKFTDRQREIYQLVLETQLSVIDSVRPGRTVRDLEMIARSYMRDHSNGLCGSVSCDRYFMHGLSHWLGMDVHDVGDYSAPLEPGMVLTIEPGIYLAEEGLGVRIEDDVLVTEEGHEVLSAAAPKTVSEIEALMRGEECLCGEGG